LGIVLIATGLYQPDALIVTQQTAQKHWSFWSLTISSC